MSADLVLTRLIDRAYRAQVLRMGDLPSAYAAFVEAAADPALVEAARRRLAECEGVPAERCFASAKAAEFLKVALQRVA